MKKFINWIKSPSSDFALVIVLLVLANLVGSRAFFRIDLTAPKSYSLSPASRRVVRTLRQPLSVSVFFSDNLPAPYNSVSQYVRDILVEYKGAANSNFSYRFYDMDVQQNETLAAQFGLRRVQIQELRNNEVGFRQAWMGLAISYSDGIQTIDQLNSTSGLEYRLTTKIAQMINTADALAGLPPGDTLTLSLYTSSALSQFNISGFSETEEIVREAYAALNGSHQNRISFRHVDPPQDQIDALVARYGMQKVEWQNADGSAAAGVVGLVLSHGDDFRLVPLSMQRSLFGFAISGLDNLESAIGGSIESLFSNSTQIGYVTGHGESPLYDPNTDAFSALIGDMYSFAELNLESGDIPANINSIVINGPKSDFSDTELYKIDQFVMRGGNVMFMIDPFMEYQSDSYYQQTQYIPIFTRLERLFNFYGVAVNKNYVMDEESYPVQQEDYGRLYLYWAPVLQQKQLSQKNPITQNLGFIIFSQSASIDIDENILGARPTVLARSSPRSWTVSENFELNPLRITPPDDKSEMRAENLAVLIEGNFRSAFDAEPSEENGTAETGGGLSVQAHVPASTQKGKIFVAGTSVITSPQLLTEGSTEPIAMFVRNVVDYMNGNEDLCAMRTKGLSLNTLADTNSPLSVAAQYFNQFGLAVLVAAAGLAVWKTRSRRRKQIRIKYNPNDVREES